MSQAFNQIHNYMFAKIFKFEIGYWFKSYLFYTYMALIFVLSIFVMGIALGIFDNSTMSVVGIKKMNSPLAIAGLLSGIAFLIYFLLPSIIGNSIYKDYKSEMHEVLFSYPFTKAQYLLAKFFSSLFASLLIVIVALLGIIIACYLPGVNQDLLNEFQLINYLQPFLLIIVPNFIFFGSIVFGVVTFSRNIFVGFIVVLVLLVLQGLAGSYMAELDTKAIGALLDPLGTNAISFITEYWTVEEQNSQLIPFEGYLLYNRLLWLGISFIVFAFIYNRFNFQHAAPKLKLFKRKNEKRFTKRNFGGYKIAELPKVNLDFSNLRLIKTTWTHALFDLKYILKNWAFISIYVVSVFVLFLILSEGFSILGTKTLPVTRIMVDLGSQNISFFLMILVFLFSGMLIHRGSLAKMHQLLDASAQPTWVFVISKFVAILLMILVLYGSTILISIGFQAYNGFYDFEIGLYLYHYFIIKLSDWITWVMLAFLFHSLIKNYVVGFVSLLAFSILLGFFPSFGIEQSIFILGEDPGVYYSDMDGFGSGQKRYFVYKLYWFLLGIVFLVLATLFYKRGLTVDVKERLQVFIERFSIQRKLILFCSLFFFIGLGTYIYYVNNVENERYSGKERELQRVAYERDFGTYNQMKHPRITATKIELDLFPKTRDYHAKGNYTLTNKTKQPIDSLWVNLSKDDILNFDFSKEFSVSLENEDYEFKVIHLTEALAPGEELIFSFEMKNKPNTWLRNNSPVRYNGTFINNNIFPSFGYQEAYEISNAKLREKYDLPFKERMKSPFDEDALQNTYISNQADWIDFETIISTSEDQIAIAPGYLEKEWVEDGQRYFHYKMDDKILNFYNFMSAEYEVMEEEHEGIAVQIFYHPGHTYNLDRMMNGAKDALSYYGKNFSPYQFRQLRIIEFPSSGGTFAQAFANTVPFSEGIGFIADVDEESGVDYPYSVTAHEVAHQWWAHQVIGAKVRGATLMSESLSEYSSLKVLEERYGKNQMRQFLKDALDKYLSGRTFESQKELPLILNENQQYIHYNKGSLVLYAISDYVGDTAFNKMLSKYIEEVAFQEPPYTTSIEFTQYISEIVPEELQYLVVDLLETITLYDNKVVDASFEKLEEGGKFQVNFSGIVSKYKSDDTGNKSYEDQFNQKLSYNLDEDELVSYPLKDYIEVGVFGKDEDGEEIILYLEKHLIEDIFNEFTIEVDLEPTEVGIDPYNKLIDRNSSDNRKKL